MKLCDGCRGVRPFQAAGRQGPVDVLGRFLGAGDEGDVLPHDVGDDAGEQRIVGAAQHHGVHTGGLERFQVLAGDGEQFRARGDAGLDIGHERRAGHGGDVQVRGGGKGVLVGAGADGGGGPDDTDAAGAGGGDGAAHGRLDHFDDGDPVAGGVAFAGVAQHGGGRRVARDGQQLHAGIHQLVHDAQGVGPDLGDGERSVGAVGGVADIEDGFVGQLVDDGPGHGESADAGIKDADGTRPHLSWRSGCWRCCSLGSPQQLPLPDPCSMLKS